MDYVGCPSELFDSLEHAARKKYGPFSIVFMENAVFVPVNAFSVEVVFVVNEVNLHSCSRYGGDLYDERPVHIVDNDIHARKADYLVQLVFPFIDASVSWHEGPDFFSSFLNALRQESSDL